MVKRYFQLKDLIDVESGEIAALMPTRFQEMKLSQALTELREFESVAKSSNSKAVSRSWTYVCCLVH